MKPNYYFLIMLVALIYPVKTHAQKDSWNGKKCAVVLTYDDALNVHLDKVIPALDKYNFKGTFYLIGSSPVVANRMAAWRKAAKNGHELGNHTLTHPCDGSGPGREWVSREADLSTYSLERTVNEIRVTNTLLNAIDGKTKRTFAYPCGDRTVHDTLYYNYVKNDFVAARGVNSGLVPLKGADMANLEIVGASDVTGEQMIAEVQKAEKEGKLIIFLFHGVGGEHPLNVDEAEHQKLLDYLKSKEKDIWIAPLVNVAEWMLKQQGK